MDKFTGALAGYKTYVVIALMMVAAILEQEGVITDVTADSALQFLGLAGGATMVAKFNRFMGTSE